MRYNPRARTIVSLARFALHSSCCFALNFTNSKAFMSDKKLPVGDVLYVEMPHFFSCFFTPPGANCSKGGQLNPRST